MSQAALTRLAVLVAAAACAAIAFGLLPALRTGTELSPAPAVIVNDTGSPVVAVHCGPACPAAGGTTVEPGHRLPAGVPRAVWQVRAAGGEVLGCLVATAAGQRLPVTRAGPCPA